MKFLIVGEPNPNSQLQSVLKERFPDTDFSIAFDAATLDQSLSQDGYDLIFIEKPLDRVGSPDLLQKLHRKAKQLPPVLVSAFEETENIYRATLDSIPEWVEWLGADGHYRFISSACEAISGYRPEDFMADPKLMLSLAHPDDRQHITDHRQEILEQSAKASEFEFRIFHRNGELRWISHRCQPLYREGAWVGHFATNRDITEQKKAAAELHLSQQAMHALMSAPTDVIILVDRQYKIVYVNQTLADRFGKRVDEIVGKHVIDVLPLSPELARSRAVITRQVFETGQMQRNEDIGVSGIFDNLYLPILDEQGVVTLVAVIARDITQRIQIENELRHSKEELQVILDGVAETIAVVNPKGELVYINQAGLRLTGYDSIEEMVDISGRPSLLNIRDEAGNAVNWDALSQFRVFQGEFLGSVIFRLQPVNSSEERWISTKATPIFDQTGELLFIVIIAHDLTEVKQNQAQLEAAQVELEKKIAERTSELNLANQELVQRVAERQRAAAQAEVLAHVAAQVNLQTDLPSTLQAICEEITIAVTYAYCSIFLYDEQKDEFRLAASNLPEGINVSVEATPRALYEQYLRAYGPVIVIPDRQALPEVHGAPTMLKYDIRTLISVPLVSNGELIGNLNVASINEVHLPSQEDLALLNALADQASIAISKARLFEQVSESRTRLQVLSEKLVEIQEAERRSLARELHDQIGQMLTSMRLNLDLALRSMPAGQLSTEETHKQLTRANETAAQLLERIREISLDLRPTLLDDLGLLPALLVQFERFTTRTNIQIHFKHSGLENRFSSQIETVAFRVIQEALTNVARHAKTGEAFVRLWVDPQFMRLQVEDHGVGFDPQVALTSTQTSGLSGMQERVGLCKGQFEIESEPGQGACLTVELPLI